MTTKPIKLISGKSPFCETFFDDAKALVKNRLGKAGEGWTIAKYLLSHERASIVSEAGFGGLNPVTAAQTCLLYTSPSPRDGLLSRMPSSA